MRLRMSISLRIGKGLVTSIMARSGIVYLQDADELAVIVIQILGKNGKAPRPGKKK